MQLSESPPPPFFLLAPTLHLVGIVKPWKQPTVAQEKYFLQFLKCLPEELQTAGDDIMLADQWSHSNGCHHGAALRGTSSGHKVLRFTTGGGGNH